MAGFPWLRMTAFERSGHGSGSSGTGSGCSSIETDCAGGAIRPTRPVDRGDRYLAPPGSRKGLYRLWGTLSMLWTHLVRAAAPMPCLRTLDAKDAKVPWTSGGPAPNLTGGS